MSAEKVLLRLVIGHESTLLDVPLIQLPPHPPHTHRWTVFVRSVDGGVLESTLLVKVVFCLHTDFANPKRGKIGYKNNYLNYYFSNQNCTVSSN